MRKPRLMTPGPAMVPEDVLLELARPVIHHRSNEAKQVVTEVLEGLKEVFQTKNDVLILTASGTGAMEAAVVNAVPPGGKALVLSAGYFGARGGLTSARRSASTPSCSRPSGGNRSIPTRSSRHSHQHPDTVCRAGHPERDLDGYRPSGRGDRPDRRRNAGPVRGRRHFGRRCDGVPDRRVGHRPALRRLAESLDAAAGPGVRVGQPQGLGQDRCVRLAQLLLQLEGGPQEDQGIRHALYSGPHPDPRPADRACGGSRTRASKTSGSVIAR